MFLHRVVGSYPIIYYGVTIRLEIAQGKLPWYFM
jgi:hypothetical protein